MQPHSLKGITASRYKEKGQSMAQNLTKGLIKKTEAKYTEERKKEEIQRLKTLQQ